ncbi:MAG: hypothetical protein WBQ64_04105 [Terriglobales bacterium]|jgi:hypothetical protein
MKVEWKHVVGVWLLTLMLGPSFLLAQNKPQNKVEPAPAPMKLKVGDMAPDFTLLAFDGKDLKKISLQDYRGKKNVALAFFVFAFTGG